MNKNIIDYFEVKNPNQTISDGYNTLTREDFEQYAYNMSSNLLSLGLNKGDRICICGSNSLQWAITMQASMYIGLIIVGLNTGSSEAEFKYLVSNFPCKYYFVEESYLKHFENVEDEKLTILTYENVHKLSKPTSKEKLLQALQIRNSLKSTTPACIQFTSGTTSMPKAVMHTYDDILTVASYTAKYCKYTNKDKVLLTVPMYHQMGCNLTFMMAMISGCSIYIMPKYSTRQTIDIINSENITSIHAVPSILEMLVGKVNDSKLIKAVIGGSIATASQVAKYIDQLNLNELYNIYGQTETFVISIGRSNRTHASLSTGKLLPYVQPFISPQGEIIIKSKTNAQHYLNECLQDKDIFQIDGIHTGDLGFIVDRKITVTGRCKDIINRGGERISPKLIEDQFVDFNGITQVVVCAIPDNVLGEEIGLFYTGTATKEQIEEKCKQSLPKSKQPKQIFKVETIPCTSSGKVKKQELVKLKF